MPSLSPRSVAKAAAAACTDSPFAKAAAAAGGDPAGLAILWSSRLRFLPTGVHSQAAVQHRANGGDLLHLRIPRVRRLPLTLAALQSDGSLEVQVHPPLMSQVNNGVLRILPYQNATVMDGSRIQETGRVIDEHRHMRLDVDNMTYEELVALEEQIGDVSTGLTESYIQENLRSTFYLPGATGVSDQFSELSLENDACIICQYAEKDFVRKHNVDEIQLAQQMWDNVSSNDKKGVYSLIVGSNADVYFLRDIHHLIRL